MGSPPFFGQGVDESAGGSPWLERLRWDTACYQTVFEFMMYVEGCQRVLPPCFKEPENPRPTPHQSSENGLDDGVFRFVSDRAARFGEA